MKAVDAIIADNAKSWTMHIADYLRNRWGFEFGEGVNFVGADNTITLTGFKDNGDFRFNVSTDYIYGKPANEHPKKNGVVADLVFDFGDNVGLKFELRDTLKEVWCPNIRITITLK